MRFADRHDAGRRLAEKLPHLESHHPVVLGLPRGGVAVAAEIAAALAAPLDVLIVRKLGAPYQPELAIGAVTIGVEPQQILNRDIIALAGVSDEYVQEEIERQLEEVRRRQDLYRRGRAALPIADRTAIVVDDGIATGATVRAALQALGALQPRHLVLAVPVAPPETVRRLKAEVDELVCLHAPRTFRAVGEFYDDFRQTSDEEVIRLLEDAAAQLSPGED